VADQEEKLEVWLDDGTTLTMPVDEALRYVEAKMGAPVMVRYVPGRS
jgi:hypothetical protein